MSKSKDKLTVPSKRTEKKIEAACEDSGGSGTSTPSASSTEDEPVPKKSTQQGKVNHRQLEQEKISSKEFEDLLSSQLQRHLDQSIGKAMQTAMETLNAQALILSQTSPQQQRSRNEENPLHADNQRPGQGQNHRQLQQYPPEAAQRPGAAVQGHNSRPIPRQGPEMAGHSFFRGRPRAGSKIYTPDGYISDSQTRMKERRRHTTPALSMETHTGKRKKRRHGKEKDLEGSSSSEDEYEFGCWNRKKSEPFAVTLATLQTSLIILYAFLVQYDKEDVGTTGSSEDSPHNSGTLEIPTEVNSLDLYYSNYQDMQVMVFMAIGVLMAFIPHYGYSSIGFCLLAATLAVQWAVICKGVLYNPGSIISLNIGSLVYGDFAAATVLITYGCIIGSCSPLELICMTMAEVTFFALNEWVVSVHLGAVDTGGSMLVHMFAAYFGLAMSRARGPARRVNSSLLGSSYRANVLAFVAVIFLFVYWPSFNSVLSSGNDKHRVVLNTTLSLFGATVGGFVISSLIGKNKLTLAHVQNGCLAGGVAIGSVVDLMLQPFGAIILGFVGGILCVLGIQYLTPLLTKKFGIHDACGVHNLHGLPGHLAAFTAVAMAAYASDCEYGASLYTLYPARAPPNGTELLKLQVKRPEIEPGLNRTGGQQACFQLAAIATTLLVSIGGGMLTGWLMRLPVFAEVPRSLHFNDKAHWDVEDETEGKEDKGLSSQMFASKVNGWTPGTPGDPYVHPNNYNHTNQMPHYHF